MYGYYMGPDISSLSRLSEEELEQFSIAARQVGISAIAGILALAGVYYGTEAATHSEEMATGATLATVAFLFIGGLAALFIKCFSENNENRVKSSSGVTVERGSANAETVPGATTTTNGASQNRVQFSVSGHRPQSGSNLREMQSL